MHGVLALAVAGACAWAAGLPLASAAAAGCACFVCMCLMAATDACLSKLGPESLAQDLARLDALVHTREKQDDSNMRVMCTYYTATMHADYQLLQACVGPGMHSRVSLQYPFSAWNASTVPSMVLAALRLDVTDASARVLEFGSGRGFCSLYLAALAPRVRFVGIDATPAHVAKAEAAKRQGRYANASFELGDGTDLGAYEHALSGIFAVEALCHVRAPDKRRQFLRGAARALRPGARLVIVDGFRSEYFAYLHAGAQRALVYAEHGFHIGPLATVREWATDAKDAGLRVVLNQDLTEQVLPFWRYGWRVARALMHLAPLWTCFVGSKQRFRHTVGNFVAVATTAQAMHAGAAKYTLLVLEHAA